MGFWTRLWHRLLFGSSPLTAQPRPAARVARPAAARPAAARPGSAAAARPAPARPGPAFPRPTDDEEDIATIIRQWVKPQPPRCVYRTRQELELALLLAWLPDAERRRFLDQLLPRAGQQQPWSMADVDDEPWDQCQQWTEPLVITAPETMTTEGFRLLLEGQLRTGCYTYCTPLEVLSRPVRMLWLLRQGRQVGQVYAALEQALGSSVLALEAAWSVVTSL